jgi:hypothetical protein
LKRDDGAIVYLNGTEIFRSNIAAGTVNYLTLAASASDDGNAWFSTNVQPALLVAGTNVLAVELHQSAANSSDISFDLEFLGFRTNALPAFTWAQSGGNWLLEWPSWANEFALVSTTNASLPIVWSLVTNGITTTNGRNLFLIPSNDHLRLFRLRR